MSVINLKKGEEKKIHELSDKINPYLDFFLDIKKIEGSASFCELIGSGVEKECIPLKEEKYQKQGFMYSIMANSDVKITYDLIQGGKKLD